MALVMRTPPSAARGSGGGLPASPWGDQEGARAQRWNEPGGVLRDVEAAGRLLSDAVAKEDEASDLADSLDAARLISQPYTTQRPEWPPLVEVCERLDLPPALIEAYSHTVWPLPGDPAGLGHR
eukprot:SM000027S09561  [mRNA]  locus=s27:56577:57367:+ [translate_table: standard]